jgi:hypothetical protein
MATPPVQLEARKLDYDPTTHELVLRGEVRVGNPPFALTSPCLRMRETALGWVVQGEGRLSFCACLGEPLAVAFDAARLQPPHDLVLHQPRLEVFGVPVAYVPRLWLRSPARPGLLAPDLAWRGIDGLLVGDGVHLPWTEDSTSHGLDLRLGAYTKGGVATQADLQTPSSVTTVRWDHLEESGLVVDARGATKVAAWDLDLFRGPRAVRSTTDLGEASKPYDRALAFAAWRTSGWTFAAGGQSTSPRGAWDWGAAGPLALLRLSSALGPVAMDATVETGKLAAVFFRAEAGALGVHWAGALRLDGQVRGAMETTATSRWATGTGQLLVAWPLVRRWESDPWVHGLEPSVAASIVATEGQSVLRGAGPPGVLALVQGGLKSTLGRQGGNSGIDKELFGGVTADGSLLARGRLVMSAPWVRVAGEAAVDTSGAVASTLRGRLGQTQGLHVLTSLAGRSGSDPTTARLLATGPTEVPGAYTAEHGWSGGATLVVPWLKRRQLVTRAGADVDLTTGTFLAAMAAVELRDPCNCLVVRLLGAHRIGRDGVDVWVTVELPR